MTLHSRIPQIARSLDEDMDAVEKAVATAIASGAASRAPHGPTGDLAEGYEAQKVGDHWAVMALWRWFFTEFGTSHSAPQPHLVPAVEAERQRIDDHARLALRDL